MMKNGLLFLVLGCGTAWGLEEKTWDLLRDNVRAMELVPAVLAQEKGGTVPSAFGVDTAPAVSEKDLQNICSLIRQDGSFQGIDYKDKGRSVWSVLRHLDYCRSLAIALHVFPESVLQQYKVHENCLLSFDWWLKNRPRNPNWWNNDVYMSQMLGNIALLLDGKDMTPERLSAFRELTDKAQPSMTGQNRMWMSWNSLLAGLVTRDEARVDKALKAMQDTVAIASEGKEGIQTDMSFHQHGAQLYQGNYGRHFLHSASKMARVATGTPWECSKKRELVENYLLDGTRWMCWGGLLDYSVWGRQMSYGDRFQGPDIVYACLNMEKVGGGRSKEVSGFAATLISPEGGNGGAEAELTGMRVFPKSDYAVHRTPVFMNSLRMSSTRTAVGEECNGDNLKGAYLSDGCLLTYRTGREYDRIFPVWDWTCIPGTTARRGFMPGIGKWSGRHGGHVFAGGLSSEKTEEGGVAGMVSSRFGLTARKSWFFYPDRVVCLGSGISSEEKEGALKGSVLTTVEQSLLRGKGSEEFAGKDVKGVRHDGTLYLFPKKSALILETARRKGNWQDIRSGSENAAEEKAVFLLAVDHGAVPKQASYIYQMFPQAGELKRDVDAIWDEVKVLRCDEKVHAVSRKGETRIVFFAPESIKAPNGETYEASEPCFMIVSSQGEARTAFPGKVK